MSKVKGRGGGARCLDKEQAAGAGRMRHSIRICCATPREARKGSVEQTAKLWASSWKQPRTAIMQQITTQSTPHVQHQNVVH
eukprot:1139049-Pelagomonas_calceolata.AAC.7